MYFKIHNFFQYSFSDLFCFQFFQSFFQYSVFPMLSFFNTQFFQSSHDHLIYQNLMYGNDYLSKYRFIIVSIYYMIWYISTFFRVNRNNEIRLKRYKMSNTDNIEQPYDVCHCFHAQWQQFIIGILTNFKTIFCIIDRYHKSGKPGLVGPNFRMGADQFFLVEIFENLFYFIFILLYFLFKRLRTVARCWLGYLPSKWPWLGNEKILSVGY